MRITHEEFNLIAAYVKEHFGINLTEKKKMLVVSRLSSTIEKLGFSTFLEYYDFLISDASTQHISELVNRITTNHTSLYREHKHFELLRDELLPFICERERLSKDIRIWSAGCSMGDEPYTIQMIVRDYLQGEYERWNTSLLATDISEKALLIAREGRYEEKELQLVPKPWKFTYFTRVDAETFRVKEDIRDDIVFRRFNLMNAFPFKKKFHVIFCRNVMIYFDHKTKHELVEKFYDQTEPGGFLFIGHSETLDKDQTRYKYVMPAVYRKE